MGSPWHTSLALILAVGAVSNPLRPRQLPWPEPVPASSIGPLDWSSIHPPIYNNPKSKSYSLQATTTTAGSSPPPSSVDWRNRSGLNYITTPQDQGVCNSCWAFAATALIEAMVRIEHGVWSKRSEADVHDGLGAACESTGNAEETLAWVAGQGPMFVNETGPDATPPGIADWPCDPYQDTRHPYEHCADRSGRATRIPFYQALGLVQDQKRWLEEYGPLIATFVLYSDFGAWKPTGDNKGVYKWDGVSESTGNHLALVVGYDDDKQAWIMKNSWGKGWGQDGFVYFAYDNANIDSWTKYGLSNVNPDPWTRRRHQSGSMMQSGNGKTHRNFELLISDSNAAGFTHVSRDSNSTEWSKVSEIQSSTLMGQPAIIGTSFNRDFHVVGINKNQTLQQWVYNQSAKKWSRVSTIEGSKIDGFPGLTQSDGSQLVMVVKHADGTLNEWQQPPNSTTWRLRKSPIASDIAQSGPSLVQSNIVLDLYNAQGSSRGNLYTVAARTDCKLQLFWRSDQEDNNAAKWSAGEVFASGIPLDTPPVMIQDYFNTANETSIGGFQLVVAVNGSVQHWERVNDDIGVRAPEEGVQGKWRLVETAGTGVKHVWALVHGSFSQKMHMVTEGADGRVSYWEWDGKWAVVEELPALSDAAWARSEPVSGG
ncbi:hypothetical protein C8A03DRAFT_17860 [Achaetomium macrosporum]|uniref:Peptidase C1A papain C-terminal domain-containing protein n=1 Tax=Achaetomium macrosporum TaxID=79813 RepID=A0AAN7C4T6_9PEZI|nr:hypothetical protein C8A03DRAFT_17860 [Achaetomium macrosporum]